MVANNAYANRYKEVAIKTATPLQLVVILYDGAIQALQEAQENLRRQDIPARARCINRSVSIITELQASLNFSIGGDIAESLDRLYNYMKQRIFKANIDQSPEPLNEVVTLLGNLRSAWNTLAAQAPAQSASKAGTAAPSPAVYGGASPAPGVSSSFNISG
jgi:flagellar secretion chaperone FliS